MFRRWCRFAWISVVAIVLGSIVSGTAAAQDDPCHVGIETFKPELEKYQILMPVRHGYRIRYDESCILNVIESGNRVMKCENPVKTLGPGEIMSQLVMNLSIECQYQQAGYYYTSPVYFEIESRDGKYRKTYHVPIYQLRIEPYSEAGRNNDFDKYIPVHSWHQNKTGLWLLFFGLAVIILAGLFIFYARATRQTVVRENVMQPIQSPIDVFMLEVSKLVHIIPTNLLEYKQYHDQLSNGFRIYLTNRYGISSMSCTTDELCRKLNEYGVDTELIQETQRLLMESDRVKFALDAPSQAANLVLLRDMEYLVTKLEAYYVEKEKEELVHAENVVAEESAVNSNSDEGR